MKSMKWKDIPIDVASLSVSELSEFGGMEELSDYELMDSKGNIESKKRKAKKSKKERIKKMKTVNSSKKKLPQNTEADEEDDDEGMNNVEADEEDDDEGMNKVEADEGDGDDKLDDVDMSAWSKMYLHESVREGLKNSGFTVPTQIQKLAIPPAMNNFDVLGAAETGSGKTLAFGIPIMNNILRIKESGKYPNEGIEKPLYSLILTPTRELAIQIKNHLLAICKHCDVTVCVVLGGMAKEKQKRLLRKYPDIVVATPGRLWELYEENDPHLNKISNVRYLVIDEADRMVEKGHFAELTHIMGIINGNAANKKRQNFVFSATLTLIHDAPTRILMKKKKNKIKKTKKLDSLTKLVRLKDPKIIDITRETGVVETLTESQIMCSNEEKDTHLYYFLQMYPGRTLIFCNSIDSVRRLKTILEYLNCHPLPLHASMPQKQRLKNLERFERSDKGVLLATDVAARGLDIKNIQHVIHFQVPRTAETYVHRSGRTARAQQEGLSLILIEPQDAIFYKKICKTLNKEKSPNFPIDFTILKICKERVTFVRNLEKMEHRLKKLTLHNKWFVDAAKEMDIDIEDENLLHDMGDSMEHAAKLRQINTMKKQLKSMLQKHVTSKDMKGSYPTKSGKLVTATKYGLKNAVNIAKNQNRKKNA